VAEVGFDGVRAHAKVRSDDGVVVTAGGEAGHGAFGGGDFRVRQSATGGAVDSGRQAKPDGERGPQGVIAASLFGLAVAGDANDAATDPRASARQIHGDPPY